MNNHLVNRRQFISNSILAYLSTILPISLSGKASHYLTFSFDDGFKKSCYKAAEIHSAYGLKACLNVIASGHLPSFPTTHKYMNPKIMGDFNDWNRLKGMGHEVMPHTWEHLNLTELSIDHAKENIIKCLEYFEGNLDGYSNNEAVFNYAYNASTPELDAFLLESVLAVRTGGNRVLGGDKFNQRPVLGKKQILGTYGKGPEYCDEFVEIMVSDFINSKGGWLIITMHGFDDEGWGPVRSSYFDKLLKRLVEIENLRVMPAGLVLSEVR